MIKKFFIGLSILIFSLGIFSSTLKAYHGNDSVGNKAPQEILDLTGVIKPMRLGKRTILYLHTEDGKRYHLLSRALWKKTLMYTRGIFHNQHIQVSGKPARNRFGKIFGLSLISIEPVEDVLSIPAEIPPQIISEDLIVKGTIHTKPGKRLRFYIASEDDGRKFLLLNQPDWKKAMHYALSRERVMIYGKPWFNRRGELIGIRFTDIIPLQ